MDFNIKIKYEKELKKKKFSGNCYQRMDQEKPRSRLEDYIDKQEHSGISEDKIKRKYERSMWGTLVYN